MENLIKILNSFVKEVEKSKDSNINSKKIVDEIEFICRNIRIKAPIRFLLSCSVAKIDKPEIDIRKPYTEIEGDDTYSGRSYDENVVQQIIEEHDLPCNTTTAYLTPAFRNRNTIMLPETELVGRQPKLYKVALDLLNEVHKEDISPEQLFKEIVRQLIIIRNENANRIGQLIKSLSLEYQTHFLSSEQIVTLLIQHLACKNSSRLPVLIVAAAYQSVSDLIKEDIKPLQAHNAADKQTGANGDIEVILSNNDNVITSYEMKAKRVTKSDIDIAIKKIVNSMLRIDNYIFITTEYIDVEVEDYARSFYDTTGIEIAILDCIGFIKHFLHFFHRRRNKFLERYQELILNEPNSSVNQPLKEAFLALRQAAETEK